MTATKPKTARTHANYAEWSRNCYSPTWPHLSRATREATGGKCCLCRSPAKVAHHAFYTQGGAGDRPGHNLFPLCAKHHREAHQLQRLNKKTGRTSGNWIIANDHPVRGRYSTQEFLGRLRQGWKTSLVPAGDSLLSPTKRRHTRKTKPTTARLSRRRSVKSASCVGAIAGALLTLLLAL